MGSLCLEYLGLGANPLVPTTGAPSCFLRASLVAQLVNNPPAVWETWVRSLGWEDPLEKGKATHCSILALESPMECTVHGVPKSDFHFISLGLPWWLS